MTIVTKKGVKGAEKYDSMTGGYNRIVHAKSEAPSSVGHHLLGMASPRNMLKNIRTEEKSNL